MLSVLLLALPSLSVRVALYANRQASHSPSALRFSPERPGLASLVRVEYRPLEELAGRSRLRMRVRYRTANEGYGRLDSRLPVIGSTVLWRAEGGLFTGEISLPDSVVYAILAVEDERGVVVDTNAGRFWELLVHDERGQPLFEALKQKANHHVVSDVAEVLEAAEAMVRFYPDRSGAWLELDNAQRRTTPADRQPVLDEALKERVAELDRQLGRRDYVAADDVASLMWMAYMVGDSGTERRWRDRLFAEHPGSGFAIEFRLRELEALKLENAGGYLDEIERLWEVAEAEPGVSARWGYDARSTIVQRALPAAVRANAFEAASRSSQRYLAHARVSDPEGDVGLWTRRIPELRDDAMQYLRKAVARLDSLKAEHRSLGQTAAAYRSANQRASTRFLVRQGELLLEEGKIGAAIDTLEVAASRAWYPYLRRPLAEAYFAAGDTAQALGAWAFVAAYGATSAFADSVRERTGPRFDEDRWVDLVEQSRVDLYGRILAESVERPVPGDLRLVATDGSYYTFDGLRQGVVTVVVFWSRFCSPSLRAMPRIKELAGRLEEAGAKLLAVTTDAPSDEFRVVLEDNRITVPVYHDVDRQATLAFRNAGTPQLYVLDAEGKIRFEAGASIDDARIFVAALLARQ